MSDPTPDPAADATLQLPEPPSPEAVHGSHRLWALLLVLDCMFVIVFGGLVASKIYQHWNEPAPLAAAAPGRRRPAKAADAAATSEAPAKPSESAPVAPAAPAPAPAPEPAPSAPPTPSPAEAPSAPVPVAEGKARAKPVEFKIKAPRADSVQVVGAFIVHGGRKAMTRESDGTWTTKLYLNPGQYRYFFFVDGRRTLDPANSHSDRGASLLTLP
jgi:hypothetical protein